MVRRCWILICILLALLAGCSRTRYRLAADRDAYTALRERTSGLPWALPFDFSLHPPPTSRLYDPTPPDDPWLPLPAPQLYAYDLPELAPRESRYRAEEVPVPEGMPEDQNSGDSGLALLPVATRLPPIYGEEIASKRIHRLGIASVPTPRADRLSSDIHGPAYAVQQASFEQQQSSRRTPALPGSSEESQPQPQTQAYREPLQDSHTSDLLLSPIPPDAWAAIPPSCLTRMLEFETLQEEYRRSHGREPSEDMLAPGKRLSLEDIVEITLLNSREYQTQKEILYRFALRLSLERYAYQLKFSPFNNRTAVNWNHTRVDGETVNGLSIPTVFQVEKMLATGGDLVARFANNIVLTFNGPTGFAADVGSDIFIDLNQTIFQRDIRFESLTQSERDVVYAARDFLRFRKQLFVQLASQYYSLIRTYRQVEIDSQNYFTLVRAFHQSQAEYRANFLPRFQLDQVEQNVLSGRSRLIATSNNLESALDNLKIRMGVPTETYVNVDLGELKELTDRDELAVSGDLIRRARQRLQEERQATSPNRAVLLGSSVVLIERMLETQRIQKSLGGDAAGSAELDVLLLRLRVDAARANADVVRSELAVELREQRPLQSRVFQRTMDLIDALLVLLERQIELAERRSMNQAQLKMLRDLRLELNERTDEIRANLQRTIDEGRIIQLEPTIAEATQVKDEAEATIQELDRVLGLPTQLAPEEAARRTLQQADRLLRESDELLQNIGAGLSPIEIPMDDAMLTALNLRLDLMNQRGDLADTWRRIKYAGDSLKSVLNIDASHRISTRRDINSPFAFTFDESDTRVGATFDAPFNRRAQRNDYRQSLVNYQAGLRQLMLLEDNIKLDVRNDLRALALDKEQYLIEVASAALAYERVVSVRLEFRLSLGRVAARDFLEAQNAYASALSNVASRHIGYIVDRMQLFLDMELLMVDEQGFWQELYDETYQPEPYYQLPPYSLPAYGELVPGLWYSKSIRRMEAVPPGKAAIHKDATDSEAIEPGEANPALNPAEPAELPQPMKNGAG